MLLQIEGHRPPSATRLRSRVEAKDHVRENVRRMRQIQRATKVKEDQKPGPQPVKALWKSSKYEGVQSKIMEDLTKEPPTPRPHSAHYLRAHSRTGWCPSARDAEELHLSDDQLTVPSAQSAREVRMVRHDIDFVKSNGRAAKHFAGGMRRSPSLSTLDDCNQKLSEELKDYKKGSVPKYLQHRKLEWEQEEMERRASIPDPDMPEGHRLMPAEEKQATLQKLRQSQSEFLQQLNSMPIRTDTLRMRSKKESLERKLTEIEEAIKIFSRGKVFVKLDA